MRYERVINHDVANGPGICQTLFVTGCTHNCKGCFNSHLKGFDSGKLWTRELEQDFIERAKSNLVDNICILGGEPLQQTMDDSMMRLLRRLHLEVKKPIWVWTGYTIESLLDDPVRKQYLDYITVLIDGKFEESLYDIRLKYMGSSNQRMVDVQKTLKNGKIFVIEVNKSRNIYI